MCGGTCKWQRLHPFLPLGLSPRVRGNQRGQHQRGPHDNRSIPACAGEPSDQSLHDSTTHLQGLSPRVRGNQCSVFGYKGGSEKVYPRVCGGTDTLQSRSDANISRRSIPACAGEPPSGGYSFLTITKGSIPACAGEPSSPNLLQCHDVTLGLSPRVRGNLLLSYKRNVGFQDQVYPRVCGGTRSLIEWHASPGKHGSIPACAGEPDTVSRSYCHRLTGLSPRVRGNPLQRVASRPNGIQRSIPACAGEP